MGCLGLEHINVHHDFAFGIFSGDNCLLVLKRFRPHGIRNTENSFKISSFFRLKIQKQKRSLHHNFFLCTSDHPRTYFHTDKKARDSNIHTTYNLDDQIDFYSVVEPVSGPESENPGPF